MGWVLGGQGLGVGKRAPCMCLLQNEEEQEEAQLIARGGSLDLVDDGPPLLPSGHKTLHILHASITKKPHILKLFILSYTSIGTCSVSGGEQQRASSTRLGGEEPY